MQSSGSIQVVLVDDHRLFRKGMVELINGFAGYAVAWEAENGKEFIDRLSPQQLPDIVLLDIAMPVMDGFETARWMEQRYPNVKILALSMFNDDETIMKMLIAGVNGYILKNADPAELRTALKTLETGDSYFTKHVTGVLLTHLHAHQGKPKDEAVKLSEREMEFLRLACTELPYKSFTPFLGVTVRVVESIRADLFKKLKISSRVGLVLYAIKQGIYKIQ
ncbi:MAG: response regulator transcription factor [Cytophagales bacterium]|nr:response regulator transcription factor [Cytophagales bacterium]